MVPRAGVVASLLESPYSLPVSLPQGQLRTPGPPTCGSREPDTSTQCPPRRPKTRASPHSLSRDGCSMYLFIFQTREVTNVTQVTQLAQNCGVRPPTALEADKIN